MKRPNPFSLVRAHPWSFAFIFFGVVIARMCSVAPALIRCIQNPIVAARSPSFIMTTFFRGAKTDLLDFQHFRAGFLWKSTQTTAGPPRDNDSASGTTPNPFTPIVVS
jgi:hypothetical protein